MATTRGATFGARLRTVRRTLRISQRTLGSAIGRSQSFVSRVENGRAPSLTVGAAEMLCSAVGGTLVFGIESPILREPRQRDAAHAICVGYVLRRLTRAGWDVEREVLAGGLSRAVWIDLLRTTQEQG